MTFDLEVVRAVVDAYGDVMCEAVASAVQKVYGDDGDGSAARVVRAAWKVAHPGIVDELVLNLSKAKTGKPRRKP